jgi:hypothetical protein
MNKKQIVTIPDLMCPPAKEFVDYVWKGGVIFEKLCKKSVFVKLIVFR